MISWQPVSHSCLFRQDDGCSLSDRLFACGCCQTWLGNLENTRSNITLQKLRCVPGEITCNCKVGWAARRKGIYFFETTKRGPGDLVNLFMRILRIAEQTATNWKLSSTLAPSTNTSQGLNTPWKGIVSSLIFIKTAFFCLLHTQEVYCV